MTRPIRIVASILAVVLIASFSLTGCGAPASGSGTGTATKGEPAAPISVTSNVKSGAAAVVGTLEQTGAALQIAEDALGEDMVIAVKRLSSDESSEMQKAGFDLLGTPVCVQVENTNSVRLDKPAVLTVSIPESQLASITSKDDVYAGYFNKDHWEYFLPDSVDLAKGVVRFTTYHFSVFGAGKLSEEEQIDRFAGQMAVQSWAKKENEDSFLNATKGYFYDAFDQLGIREDQAKGKLLRAIMKEDDFGELLAAMESNDATAFATKVGEITGDALLNQLGADSGIMGNAVGVVSSVASAAGALSEGDREGAMRAIAQGMVDYFPATKAMQTAIEVMDAGIQEWTDSEIEYAYQAYKNGAVDERGYNVTKGNWEELAGQMDGISHKIYRDAITAYARRKGVPESSLSTAELDAARNEAERKLKARFDKRLAFETDIAKQKEDHARTIAAFKRMHLLDRGSFGFDVSQNIEDRLRRLYVVMDNIREMTGSDVPIDDMCVLIGSWYNDRTKTKADFFAKMKEMGYPKGAGTNAIGTNPATGGEYAWVLVQTVDYDAAAAFVEANKSPVYENKASYAPGAFSVTTIYEGDSDDYYKPPVVKGESLGVQAQWSKPPQTIRRDEAVTLNLTLGITANTQSYYTWSGSACAYFDVEGVEPGSSTRAAVDLVNDSGTYFFETKKGNNYKTFNETVSAKPWNGSAPGDRMELLATFFMTCKMGTAYVYEWTAVGATK